MNCVTKEKMMKINKANLILNRVISLVQIVVAVPNLIFFGIGGIGIFFDKNFEFGFAEWVIVLTICILAGCMLYCGIKRIRFGKKIRNYVNLIGNAKYISIKEVAQSSRESESQIISDFEWLIKKQFFVNAYIDYDDGVIAFGDTYRQIVEQRIQEEEAKKCREYVSVVCDCCGGTTKIEVGGGGVCDYCRAPIGKYKELDD